MRRALPRFAGRASGSTAAAGARAGEEAWWLHDAKALKEAQVAAARERVFGPQGNMPGDRYWRKKLEGKTLMQWYFPSKYNLQDFRVDDYFEMQAERFAPREVHECMPALTQMLEKVSEHRETLRSFFSGVDEPTFLDNPTLQDLYGLFRLVDPDPALSFQPPPLVFLEHSPLFGQRPPFMAFASAGQEAAEEEQESNELHALFLFLASRVGADEASALEARVARLQSLEDVRALLTEEAARLNVMIPFEQLSVAIEELEVEASTAVASASSRRGRRPKAADRPAAVAASAEEAERLVMEEEQAEAVAAAPHEEETPRPAEAEEEEHRPFAGFLGTWGYQGGTFEVSQSEDGQLRLAGRLVKDDVSGRLEPDGDALLCELQPLAGGSALGHLRLQAGDAPGLALLAFRRAGKSTWQEMPAELLEPAVPPPAAQASPEPAAEAEPVAEAVQAAEAAEEAKDERAAPAEAAPYDGDSEDEYLPVPWGEGAELVPEPQRRLRLQAYALRRSHADRAAKEREKAEAELKILRSKGPQVMRKYLARRHRFIDPMYRRRRLKWIERLIVTGRNKETEIKFNSYYTVHPDDQADWPTNKGSVTVVWPSPYH